MAYTELDHRADVLHQPEHEAAHPPRAKQLQFWRNTLSTAPTAHLPFVRIIPAPPADDAAEREHIRFDEATVDAVVALSIANNVAPYMTFLSAMVATMFRYTSSTMLPVTVLPPGAPHPLILSVSVNSAMTFRSLLHEVDAAMHDAATNGGAQPEAIAAVLDLPVQSLTTVVFALDNTPRPLREAVPESALAFGLWEDEAELNGEIVVDPARCSLADARVFINHMRELLANAVARPGADVGALAMITADERDMLRQFNMTDLDFPEASCVHALFEEQAARQGYATVFIDGSHTISYYELNRRANWLAHVLRRRNINPGCVVALAMPRSLDLLIGLFAVLKAGGTYLALDPSMTPEQRAEILADSGAVLALTLSGVAYPLPETLPTMAIDDESLELSKELEHNPESGAMPEDAAYLLYVPGPDGRLVGVLGTHKSIANRAFWGWRVLPFNAHERCSQHTPLHLPDSIWELFGPSLCGIPSVMMSDEEAATPEGFVNALHEREITRLVMTPERLAQIMRLPDSAEKLARVQMCLVNGNVPPHLALEYRSQVPESRLIVLSGAVEAGVDALWYDTATLPADAERVPLGTPIGNIQAFVLDHDQQQQPVGALGVLHLGGVGLSLDYVGRHDLSEQRFVPNPARPYERLFRTDHIVRRLPNGTLEYHGSVEQSISLRGQSIDLSQIEQVLAAHPAVGNATVVLREAVGTGDGQQLVAYVTPRDNTALDELARQVQQFAAEHLPRQWRPGAIIPLAALPYTENGTIDQGALPAPDALPTPPLVLPELPPLQPGDAGYAEVSSDDAQATLVLMQKEGGLPPVFCFHDGSGEVSLFDAFARACAPDLPVWGIRAAVDTGLASADPVALAQQYVAMITETQSHDPYILAGRGLGALLALEVARLLHAQGREIGQLLIFDTAPPIPPWRDPPSRWSLFSRNFGNWLRYDMPTARETVATGDYVPESYAGRVTLFHAEGRSLFDPGTDVAAWSRVAEEGVSVVRVRNSYQRMLRKGYVQALADNVIERVRTAL